jgi:hypothetical protein
VSGLEVDDRRGGEQRVEPSRIAQVEGRASEAGALDGRIELVEDRWDDLVAGVDIVSLDRVEQPLEVAGEELRQGDRQRQVELG